MRGHCGLSEGGWIRTWKKSHTSLGSASGLTGPRQARFSSAGFTMPTLDRRRLGWSNTGIMTVSADLSDPSSGLCAARADAIMVCSSRRWLGPRNKLNDCFRLTLARLSDDLCARSNLSTPTSFGSSLYPQERTARPRCSDVGAPVQRRKGEQLE